MKGEKHLSVSANKQSKPFTQSELNGETLSSCIACNVTSSV